MQKSEIDQTAKIISLDAVRERRKYIAIAYADENWLHTKASFALSDIELTDDDAECADRLIAGVLTHEEAIEDFTASMTW